MRKEIASEELLLSTANEKINTMKKISMKSHYIKLLASLNPTTHIEVERCLNFYGYMNTQQISTQELHDYCVFIGII